MPTSDEDLQKQQERVAKLRGQVADAEMTRETRERELSNDITMTQLEAEEAQLDARLALAKQQGRVSAVKDGAAAPLDAAKEALTRSVAAEKAASGDAKAVDPKTGEGQELNSDGSFKIDTLEVAPGVPA